MLTITPIRAYSDNYIWMIQRDKLPQVVLVDPGQAEPVINYLQEKKLHPVAILITHQHYDHTGGVKVILEKYPDIKIIGPAIKPSKIPLKIDLPIIDLFTQVVSEGSTLNIPELDIYFEVMEIPGHTLDHLAYVGEGIVFCGDTLFAAGCGRVFSGTSKMFENSLAKLMALPKATQMYCAHEYTVDNLGFAKWVEPESIEITQRLRSEEAKQKSGLPTVPTTVEIELKTNPFVRLANDQVKQAAEKFRQTALNERWQIFSALREWKDSKYD